MLARLSFDLTEDYHDCRILLLLNFYCALFQALLDFLSDDVSTEIENLA